MCAFAPHTPAENVAQSPLKLVRRTEIFDHQKLLTIRRHPRCNCYISAESRPLHPPLAAFASASVSQLPRPEMIKLAAIAAQPRFDLTSLGALCHNNQIPLSLKLPHPPYSPTNQTPHIYPTTTPPHIKHLKGCHGGGWQIQDGPPHTSNTKLPGCLSEKIIANIGRICDRKAKTELFCLKPSRFHVAVFWTGKNARLSYIDFQAL